MDSESPSETPEDQCECQRKCEWESGDDTIHVIHADDEYVYQPLDVGDDEREFRILILGPSILGEVPEIYIAPCSARNAPPYTAISYCWGETSAEQYLIFCTDADISATKTGDFPPSRAYMGVSKTVYQLLQDCRHDTLGFPLWIDAICINQNDLQERSQQVRIMQDIYHGADAVMVWLGRIDEKQANHATEGIKRLCQLEDSDEVKTRSNVWQTNPRESRLCIPDLGRPEDEGIITYTQWLGLIQLLGNPWFTRTWTLQEVALARVVGMRYGCRDVSWDDLATACRVAADLHLAIVASQAHFVICPNAIRRSLLQVYAHLGFQSHQNRREYEDFESRICANLREAVQCASFASLFSRTHGRGATDPRDKVYGLLGLATMGQRGFQMVDRTGRQLYMPRVDYSLSIREVYIEAAAARMAFHGHGARLHFLEDAGHIPKDRLPETSRAIAVTEEDWPSWLPDWTIPAQRPRLMFFCKPWAASGRCSEASLLKDHEHADTLTPAKRPCLCVRGVLTLTIKHLLHHQTQPEYQRHADVLNQFPCFYPTTASTYLDLYLKVLDPESGYDACIPKERRTSKFWQYLKERESFSAEESLEHKLERIKLQTPVTGDDLPQGSANMTTEAERASSARTDERVVENDISNAGTCGHHKQRTQADSSRELPPAASYTTQDQASGTYLTPRITSQDIERLAKDVTLGKDVLPTAERLIAGRHVFISTSGFMGQVPDTACEGDEIAILFGTRYPYVIRRDGDQYLLIGPCYVLGLMEGEAMEDLDEESITNFYFW